MKADMNNLFKIVMLIILFICLLLHLQRYNHDNEIDKKVSEILRMQNQINDKFNDPFKEWFNCNLIDN